MSKNKIDKAIYAKKLEYIPVLKELIHTQILRVESDQCSVQELRRIHKALPRYRLTLQHWQRQTLLPQQKSWLAEIERDLGLLQQVFVVSEQ